MHDLVDAGLFGVDLRLARVLLQPAPLAVLPVKSMILTSGRSASVCAVLSPAACATSVTTFGSKPASASTSRAICTVIASGRIAFGCGLTITALPVARLANRPG